MKDKMNTFIKEFKDIHELEQVILSKSNECKRKRKNDKDFSVNPDKINNLKAACKALVRADSYNGSILRGILAADIQNNHAEAMRVYDIMIERLPNNLQAYFHYSKFLTRVNHIDKLQEVTAKMMKAIESTEVPTDEWMEAHMTRAHCLVQLGRTNGAISVLEELIPIIPPLPIPGLSYIQKVDVRKRLCPENIINHASGAINIGYHQNQTKTDIIDEFLEGENSENSKNYENDESGEIQIKVTPRGESRRTKLGNRLKDSESTFNENSHLNMTRNSRPFASSFFLQGARQVIISQFKSINFCIFRPSKRR